MESCSKVKYYLNFGIGGICLGWVSLLIKFGIGDETKLRKGCSKKLIEMVTTKLEVVGELDPSAQLLMGNHTTMLDIALLETAVPEKIIWVAKKELGDYPLYGNIVTKTGMILADRSKKGDIVRVLKEVKRRVEEGYKVAIFPEGTRNRKNPATLLPFKRGALGIAEKLDLKVQPFVILRLPYTIQNNCLKKGRVELHFLPPFKPSEWGKGWAERMREQMLQLVSTNRYLY